MRIPLGERALDWLTRWPEGPLRVYDVDEDALMYDDCPPRCVGGTDEGGVSHTHGYDADLGREFDAAVADDSEQPRWHYSGPDDYGMRRIHWGYADDPPVGLPSYVTSGPRLTCEQREEVSETQKQWLDEQLAKTMDDIAAAPPGLWPTVESDGKEDALLREEITEEEWETAYNAWREKARSTTAAVPEARAEMLDDVKKLITGDRNKHYGNPTQNFTNTAALWNVQFGHKFRSGEQFTAADVAQAMIQLKMARMVASSKPDHWTDVAGYAACGYECDVDT